LTDKRGVGKTGADDAEETLLSTPIPPLNGENTLPLTDHAWAVLGQLARGPIPSSEINPGVNNRFRREDLAETVELPSTFASHKGKKIAFTQITAAGRARLAERV
jgi:hypothetical protein